MSFVRRPQGVLGLIESPEFTTRLLARIRAYHPFSYEKGVTRLDIETDGSIVPELLQEAVIVYVQQETMCAARVHTVGTRGDCYYRLYLRPWKKYEGLLGLEEGIYIWMGAVWRHIPLTHTALH